ncbi:hypothetical protein PR08_gp60 [Idiomarinaceae phage Phi1M2-2]|uniref:hypothetical protein n=1 Tax=Idiomarinaceae phage Phi1M2-2 TaxID=1527515 RepID=UPI0004F5FC5A|nr:hypothetical protein PR08_gp60 [Idiomarinaceae phage Phi1M2-2]AIM40817.1 hypothetical protein M22_060 [Idiomarinaceae phage Phi1M2-2]
MESIVNKTLVVKLVLNASEASLLKQLVQNSDPNEPEEITDFKEKLFHSIPSFEELATNEV